MKTLIINGSPKKDGDTAALIKEFSRHLQGEVLEISHFNGISPCNDCRYCWENDGCVIDDDMQRIYSYLEECDNLVLASPVWFSSVSGPLLNIASRLQTYFAARFFRDAGDQMCHKNSVLIFAGAEPGTERSAEVTAKIILKQANALPCAAFVKAMNTNEIPAAHDASALAGARNAALLLNEFATLFPAPSNG